MWRHRVFLPLSKSGLRLRAELVANWGRVLCFGQTEVHSSCLWLMRSGRLVCSRTLSGRSSQEVREGEMTEDVGAGRRQSAADAFGNGSGFSSQAVPNRNL